jgi:DNA-nicking Smr family endonuclease
MVAAAVARMSATDYPRRRRRRLSDEEQNLWGSVARSVRPLSRARSVEISGRNEAPSPGPRRDAVRERPLPAAKTPVSLPPLTPLDRRTRQKLARGRDTIDARIDLHGKTQAQAYAALRHFLLKAQADDARYVLVVTGKGRNPEHGVLRRQVPRWLGLHDFRSLVVGFDSAHVGHGGEGALYVRVRRKK